MVSDRVHLAALELQRARHALVRMITLLIVAAILVMTAWFALWVAIAFTLLSSGMPAGLVFGFVLLCNGLGGWLALLRASSLVSKMRE